jgi:hypothetical protein
LPKPPRLSRFRQSLAMDVVLPTSCT